MKVAVIGSRNINVENIGKYLPENTDELVSGGAKGIDTCVKEYAIAEGSRTHNGLKCHFCPSLRYLCREIRPVCPCTSALI